MKSNFKFYFLMIIISSFLASVLYGVGQTMVEQHITFFSFSLLVVLVIGISGMMRSVASLAPAEVSSK